LRDVWDERVQFSFDPCEKTLSKCKFVLSVLIIAVHNFQNYGPEFWSFLNRVDSPSLVVCSFDNCGPQLCPVSAFHFIY
jgi:hypothetical protein